VNDDDQLVAIAFYFITSNSFAIMDMKGRLMFHL
jgi:hypothetical protein